MSRSRSSKMHLTSLNFDILDHLMHTIQLEGDRTPDLIALASTCRSFHNIGIRHLLRDVFLDSYGPPIIAFLRYIIREPSKALFIRAIHWYPGFPAASPADDEDVRNGVTLFTNVLQLCEGVVEIDLDCIETMLALEPRLKTVIVERRACTWMQLNGDNDMGEGRAQDLLRHIEAPIAALTLRLYDDPWTFDSLKPLEATLRNLKLYDMSFRNLGNRQAVCFPHVNSITIDGCDVPSCALVSAFPNLQFLNVGPSALRTAEDWHEANMATPGLLVTDRCWPALPFLGGSRAAIWSLALRGGRVFFMQFRDSCIEDESGRDQVVEVVRNTRPVIISIDVALSLDIGFFTQLAAAAPDLLALELYVSCKDSTAVGEIISYLVRQTLCIFGTPAHHFLSHSGRVVQCHTQLPTPRISSYLHRTAAASQVLRRIPHPEQVVVVIID